MKVKIIKNDIDLVVRASEEAINIALDRVGILAQENAADRAPVDTGRLKGSMQHEVGKKKVYVGSNVEYAPYVEFRDATHRTGQAHFLRDAMTKHTDKYKDIIEKILSGF
jgi:phage gpG-like protein